MYLPKETSEVTAPVMSIPRKKKSAYGSNALVESPFKFRVNRDRRGKITY